MRRRTVRSALVLFSLMIIGTIGFHPAAAIHFYRNTGSGCSAADGALTDDPPPLPEDPPPVIGATVILGHNTFSDGVKGTGLDPLMMPVRTTINAGESVTWTWNSSHCHSVTSYYSVFDSGFHYPTTPPESPQVVPGFFEYPILDDSPTLSFTHTFATVGDFSYFCVHHESIGMVGIIHVVPA